MYQESFKWVTVQMVQVNLYVILVYAIQLNQDG